MERIGLIVLGLMGNPMTLRLLGGGYPVTVWNRSAEKARGLLEAGAAWADSPREVAAASDVVITMVANSHASEEVVRGASGVLAGAHKGLVLIDMGSIDPDTLSADLRAAGHQDRLCRPQRLGQHPQGHQQHGLERGDRSRVRGAHTGHQGRHRPRAGNRPVSYTH